MKHFVAKRLTALLAALLLAACHFGLGSPSPHSDYFVVAFLPGTPAPSETGIEALGNAVDQASRSQPGFIAIMAAAPEGDAEPALEKARADAIFAAFAKAGIDTGLIKVDLNPSTEKGYEERKDSLIVQLGYGAPPQS